MMSAAIACCLLANAAPTEPARDAFAEMKDAQQLLARNDCDGVRGAQAAMSRARALPDAAVAEKLAHLVDARIARTFAGLKCADQAPAHAAEPRATHAVPAARRSAVSHRGEAPATEQRAPSGTVHTGPGGSAPPSPCPPQNEAVIRYDEVRRVIKDDEAACAHPGDERLCRVRLPLERNEQAEAALEALSSLPRICPEWGRVRTDLDLVVANAARDAGAILDLVEQRVASKELTLEDMGALLDERRARLDLIALLSRPDSKAAIAAFLALVHRRFPHEQLAPAQDHDGVLDASTMLAFFRRHSHDEIERLLVDARDAGLWMAHWRDDELRTLIALENGVNEKQIEHFVEGFRPWISAMSPLDARREIYTDKLDPDGVVRLLDKAKKALAGPRPCAPAPTEQEERALPPDRLADWLLCGSFVGLLIVEVGVSRSASPPSAPTPGALIARASWRIHEESPPITAVDNVPSLEFDSCCEGLGARATGTARLQAEVGSEFGEILVERRERFSRVAKLLLEAERARQLREGPSMLSQVPLALVFAGLPYWRDPTTPAWARWTFSGLDLAGLILAGSFFSESVSARNGSAVGQVTDAQATFEANRWRTAAGYAVISVGVLRAVAATCYWKGWCR